MEKQLIGQEEENQVNKGVFVCNSSMGMVRNEYRATVVANENK